MVQPYTMEQAGTAQARAAGKPGQPKTGLKAKGQPARGRSTAGVKRKPATGHKAVGQPGRGRKAKDPAKQKLGGPCSCGSTESCRWYKGPRCHTCYMRERLQRLAGQCTPVSALPSHV